MALSNSGWLGWTAISRPAGTASTKDGVSNREPDRKSGCPVGLIFLGGFAPLRDKFFSLAEAQRTQSKTRKLRFLIASWQTLAATAEETEQNGNRSFLSAFSARDSFFPGVQCGGSGLRNRLGYLPRDLPNRLRSAPKGLSLFSAPPPGLPAGIPVPNSLFNKNVALRRVAFRPSRMWQSCV